jgi:hypothetical protein
MAQKSKTKFNLSLPLKLKIEVQRIGKQKVGGAIAEPIF